MILASQVKGIFMRIINPQQMSPITKKIYDNEQPYVIDGPSKKFNPVVPILHAFLLHAVAVCIAVHNFFLRLKQIFSQSTPELQQEIKKTSSEAWIAFDTSYKSFSAGTLFLRYREVSNEDTLKDKNITTINVTPRQPAPLTEIVIVPTTQIAPKLLPRVPTPQPTPAPVVQPVQIIAHEEPLIPQRAPSPVPSQGRSAAPEEFELVQPSEELAEEPILADAEECEYPATPSTRRSSIAFSDKCEIVEHSEADRPTSPVGACDFPNSPPPSPSTRKNSIAFSDKCELVDKPPVSTSPTTLVDACDFPDSPPPSPKVSAAKEEDDLVHIQQLSPEEQKKYQEQLDQMPGNTDKLAKSGVAYYFDKYANFVRGFIRYSEHDKELIESDQLERQAQEISEAKRIELRKARMKEKLAKTEATIEKSQNQETEDKLAAEMAELLRSCESAEEPGISTSPFTNLSPRELIDHEEQPTDPNGAMSPFQELSPREQAAPPQQSATQPDSPRSIGSFEELHREIDSEQTAQGKEATSNPVHSRRGSVGSNGSWDSVKDEVPLP